MSEAAPDVHDLVERIEELEARVAELEPDDTTQTESAGYGDHRDQAVLACLAPGGVVTLSAVRKLYRSETDVTNDRTVKRRTKALLQDGPFEPAGSRRWTYTGGADA
jgi:hypothetical protein